MSSASNFRKMFFQKRGWEYIATEAAGATVLAILICQYALRFLAHQPGL